MIVVLFGQLGSGKNYVGRVLESEFGFRLYDADEDLTDAMRGAIADCRPFTDEMRDEFIEVVCGRVSELIRVSGRLAVAQALFKNRHRRELLDHFPEAKLVWVRSDPEVISVRLAARAGHVAGLRYAEIINPLFEFPDVPHLILVNDGDRKGVVRQLRSILKEAGETLERRANFGGGNK